jgi:hypothetical protein
LLSEEWDVASGRQIGNVPQAYSHIGIVNTASNLTGDTGPAQHRARGHSDSIGRRFHTLPSALGHNLLGRGGRDR